MIFKDDAKILAQIKPGPSVLKFATVINFSAFVCALLAFLLGLGLLGFKSRIADYYEKPLATLFARLGAGFASAAFLFDSFFAICNPGGGLGFGIAFITIAMFILHGFAFVPVLFFAGTRTMKVKEMTTDEYEQWKINEYRKIFAAQEGNVPDEKAGRIGDEQKRGPPSFQISEGKGKEREKITSH